MVLGNWTTTQYRQQPLKYAAIAVAGLSLTGFQVQLTTFELWAKPSHHDATTTIRSIQLYVYATLWVSLLFLMVENTLRLIWSVEILDKSRVVRLLHYLVYLYLQEKIQLTWNNQFHCPHRIISVVKIQWCLFWKINIFLFTRQNHFFHECLLRKTQCFNFHNVEEINNIMNL